GGNIMERRVVITGMGIISPVGIGKEKFWNSIQSGQSGIDIVTRFDIKEYSSKLAAEVKDFQVTDFISKKEARRMDLFSQFAMAASIMAMEDSAMLLDDINLERMGVIIGTGCGGLETFEKQHNNLVEKGPKRVSPFFIPMMISNMASGNV